MVEAVRLVIWDLDETFWQGTLTEGGIKEYSRRNHDTVVELAGRGIVSSVCSKNDPANVLPILEQNGILDYFVFPSITWEPKGVRLAQMIDDFQLRAATVLFIDDNPNNRAEAKAMLPDIQVEDETFALRMLDDARFKGKSDPDHSRLKQYRLLEKKKGDQQTASGTNEAFLRGCDVRVFIDFDVEKSIDRAIELINRTNQLNFTKTRLSEDIDLARTELRRELAAFDRQAGLVRVVDKYGDYGYVGFFMTASVARKSGTGLPNTRLRHFCFSCRTLGMLIEQWIYNYLGQPEIDIKGEVLTDLAVQREIDWVRQVESIDDSGAAHAKVSPFIYMFGGCEAHAIGVYLRAYTDVLDIVGNYASEGIFVRTNSAKLAIQTCCTRLCDCLVSEAKTLGLEPLMHASDIFNNSPDNALYVFNLGLDYHDPHHYIRHKRNGWRFVIEPQFMAAVNFLSLTAEDLVARMDANPAGYAQSTRDHILTLAHHIRENYEFELRQSDEDRIADIRDLADKIPYGSRCVFIVDHDKQRAASGDILDLWWIGKYHAAIKALTQTRPHVGVVSVSDAISSNEDMMGANHYTRVVYLKCATMVAELAASLQPRQRP